MDGTPIFRQLADERLLNMTDPPPEMDAQSRAYREMRPEDAVPDDRIADYAVRTHPPLEDADALLDPDYYDRIGWDAGREDPR